MPTPDQTPPPSDTPPIAPAEQTPNPSEQKDAAKEGAKAERGELAADQTADIATDRREELKSEIYHFTEDEKAKYKEAFEKDLKPAALASLTLDQLATAEIRVPGITKILFKTSKEKNKETFAARNNHDIEWQKGLKDLVDENVSEITLFIHPKNLTKGGNQALLDADPKAQEVQSAYQETPPRIIYFERKSTRRENGSFYNDDGYFRIFDGDTWSIDKVLTTQKLAAQQLENVEAAASRPHQQPELLSADSVRKSADQPPEQLPAEAPIQANKPASIDAALDTYGDAFIDECERQNVPVKLVKFMYALSRAESGWSMRADNDITHAYGLGQLLPSTARSLHKGLIKSGRTDIPTDTAEFMRQMKSDARLQIAAFVRLVKSEAKSTARKVPGHNPLIDPDDLGMAFMAIAHHDGQGGVNGYIRWWKAQGSPDTIPKFPDKETAQEYLKASFQRSRSLGGNEGTNGLIDWAHNIARTAESYETKVASYIQEKRALAAKQREQSGSNPT